MRTTFVSLPVVLCLSSALLAQSTGRISGSVVDASGAAVPGAAVKLYLPGGKQPVLTSKTTAEGLFNLVSVRPVAYDLTVEATGFAKAVVRNVKVDPARSTDLSAIKLELPAVTQSIDVDATVQNVQTSTSEVSSTVTTEQVRRLPLLDRDPLALMQTQAGVVSNANSPTVINGQRTSYANMTIDGINIQDNFIRDNALDYSPNMPLLGQVNEMTVSTSNTNASMGGGSAQVTMVTPSGTNDLHGTAYWYNRNSYFSANDWFNNKDGVDRAFLNQNQLGGSIGGPIKKDKLFFYTNYEAYRQHQQTGVNRTILTSSARSGIFTYRSTSNVVQSVNLLGLRNITIDPVIQGILSQVPAPDKINNFDTGDSSSALLRNTAGYRFLEQSNRTRDNIIGKVDFNLSTKQVFSGTVMWNRDNLDSTDSENDYAVAPKVTNTNRGKLVSGTWRWTPSARMTNAVNAGFNIAPGDFPTTQQFGSYILDGFSFSNPINTQRRQGRNTNTYSVSDNAAYQRGRHNVQFGFQSQFVTAKTWDDAGITPVYTIGMGRGNPALQTSDLPGIRNADLTSANLLLASLGGYVTSSAQTFNITGRSSGYVPGASNTRNYLFNQYAFYVTDQWKVTPRLTVTLGVRYELFGVPDERDGLELAPVLNGTPQQTMLGNSTLDYAGSAAGRPWYARDKNNFGPNVGVAWDVFGNGKTAVRGGYSIHYVNDQTLLSPITLMEFNSGLVGYANGVALSGRAATGLPALTAPTYHIPRTFADNYAEDTTSVAGMVNPSLRTPYVQQWSFGIQQQIKSAIVEVRYVGNHSTRGLRAFDLNQVVIKENGFLDDFIRARGNGFAAQASGRAFNPAYNANIPGSQPLTVFPKLYNGGTLSDATYRNLIMTGQVGELAAEYAEYGENGSVQFFRNPNTLASDYLTNYSNSTYNSLQVEVRHRMAAGFDFQANYTFSKVLSDAAGTSQSRIEHFLDSANPRLGRSRADFDLTHMIKGNAIYELPFGPKHRLNYKPLERLLGGWSMSGIMTWQSGSPFSIVSARGTLNRTGGGRSDYNTANTNLTKSQLDKIMQFRMTGDGPMFFDSSVINTDGRAVASDGQAPFSGEAFFEPGPGTVGGLQRRMFSGPWTFNLDFGIQKETKITEKKMIELRMEGTNILNHATFFMQDQIIDSATFGKVTDTYYQPRIIQFGLYLKF